MPVKTFAELIDWTRQLHEQLAVCLAHCATEHEEERARGLLDYLASHERKLENIVAEFEKQADFRAMGTWIYDYMAHKPIDAKRACDGHYVNLDFHQICQEVFEFHDQVVALYKDLARRAEIPEARELLESLLEMEEHEAMRLSRQVGRMEDL